jgi:hypothetical protein
VEVGGVELRRTLLSAMSARSLPSLFPQIRMRATRKRVIGRSRVSTKVCDHSCDQETGVLQRLAHHFGEGLIATQGLMKRRQRYTRFPPVRTMSMLVEGEKRVERSGTAHTADKREHHCCERARLRDALVEIGAA